MDLLHDIILKNSLQRLLCAVCANIVSLPWDCSECGLLCSGCRQNSCWKYHDAECRADLYTEIMKTYQTFPSMCVLCPYQGTYSTVVSHINEVHTRRCQCGALLSLSEWPEHKAICTVISEYVAHTQAPYPVRSEQCKRCQRNTVHGKYCVDCMHQINLNVQTAKVEAKRAKESIVEAQEICCIEGCANKVSKRTRFSLHQQRIFKNNFIVKGWNKVCDPCYFQALYQNKNKI